MPTNAVRERERRLEEQERQRGRPTPAPAAGRGQWWRQPEPAAAAPVAAPAAAPARAPSRGRPWMDVGVGPWGPAPLGPVVVAPAPSPLAARGPMLPTVLRPAEEERGLPTLPGATAVARGLRRWGPVTAMETAAQRIGEAWRKVVAPREAGMLGAVLERGMGEAQPSRPRSFAEMMAGPTMLAMGAGAGPAAGPVAAGPLSRLGAGAPAAGEARPEMVGQILGGALGRVGEVAGAAWQAGKQVPVAGMIPRAIEAAGATGIEVLSTPAKAIEEMLGKAGQTMPGGMGLPPLTPARQMTPEQQAEAQKISEQTHIPLYVAQQGVLAAARRGAQSLREYSAERYGQGAQVEQALGRVAYGLGYSSHEAQVAGLDRLMAGEDLNDVTSGRQVNVMQPTPEDMQAFRSYVEGIRQRDGEDAAAAAAQQVQQTGMIPGQSDTWNELIFQVGLDPLNLLDIGAWQRGAQLREARAAARFAGAAEVAEVAGDVAQYADEVADGARLVLDHSDEAAKAVGRADAGQGSWLSKLWEKYNPFAATPRAAAETMAGTAYQVVTPAIMQVESADEARAMVRAMVENPQALTGTLGNVPLSQAAQDARPLLAQVVGDLDDAKKFPSLVAPEFDRFGFLADLDTAMAERALEMTGAATETPTRYQQFANGFRSTMSEYYLRTPGYAIRNAAGDLMTMAWDGVATLDGRGAIDDFMTRFGPTTRRVSEAAAAGAEAEIAGSKLPGLLGEVSGQLGTWIGSQEEGRYTRAFYAGLKKAVSQVWAPTLPEELASMLDANTVRALEARLAQGMNADEFVDAVRAATGPKPMLNLATLLENPDDLSVGMRLFLEGELGKVEDIDEIDEVVDSARAMVQDNVGRAFAADPTPPGRRIWSDVEAVQDLREEQGYLDAFGRTLGVEEAEIAQTQQHLADALAPGEAGIRQAEETLAATVGGQFDENQATLVRQVRAETGRMTMEARASADWIRADAWRRVREGEDAQVIWPAYFQMVEKVHADNQAQVLARLEDGIQQVQRLQAGETLEVVTGRGTREIVEESLAQLRALAGDVAGRQERLRRMGLEDFVNFDEMLDAQRLTVDTAEAEAWRMMGMNPNRDGLDVVMSTQDAVDRMARGTAEEMARVREMMLHGRINKKKYAEIGQELWQGFFRDASQGWDLARWELAQLPLSPGAQSRALQALGWPVEEAGRLGAEEIKAVLGGNVHWDMLMNAPAMPIEEAMRGTLVDVAQQAGLDLTRSADWGVDEWRQVQEQARTLADQAGTRASMPGRMGMGAIEEAAAAAEVGPRTVSAGMDIQWPQSVDDVARSMGIRPQGASAEDWARVAEYAENRGREAQVLGTEAGRAGMAAQEAQRLPEWGQMGGQEAIVRRGRLSFAQEQGRVGELAQAARGTAEETVQWVLGEAGFSADEMAGLNWQQQQKLVEEIGQGELLKTGAGRPVKIDAIDVERRAELLQQLPSQVQEAAFGVGMEPEAAGGYRWQEVATEARRRAEGSKPVIQAPGMYDAAGFPMTREAPRMTAPARIVERAEEMVPEAERLGRGRAMVGFEQREATLADRYADIEEMARARGGLLQDGRRLGETVDVPVGVVTATTERAAGMYGVNLLDEQNQVLRTYWYDDWTSARRARDEARSVIEAGTQGQKAMVDTAWSAWHTDDVARADRRAAAAGGYAMPPTLSDMAQVMAERELAALEDVRTWGRTEWAVAGEAGPVPPQVQAQLERWAKTDLTRQWSEARTVAVDMARQGADFSVLDYAGGRKRFDNWLSTVCPYSYWMTRSARNWALRAAERPGVIAQYARYRQAIERTSAERGYRARFEGMVEVPVKGMPAWTGQALFFDPTRLLLPFSQLPGMGTEIEDQEPARNLVEMLYRVGQKVGLRPYGFIEWPLQYFNWIGKREEMGFVLPHTGAIQAATAAAGIGAPGGVNIEAPVRRMVGMPEQEPYQAYRVNRMLANMSADNPEISQDALRAQELQRLVEAGQLRLNEAMGWESGRVGPPVASDAVLRIARDQGWSEPQVLQAQTLLQTAVQRAGLERGLRAGSSFAGGVTLAMFPSGERRQLELEREQRGTQYSPLTGMGSRAGLEAWRAAHPETVPRRLAGSALPGAAEFTGTTPGEQARYNEYRTQRDRIQGEYAQEMDDLARREPWNRAGIQELQDQQRAQLEQLRDRMGLTEQAEEGAGYQPRSVYGARPEEVTQIRQQEVLGAVSGAMPRVAQFAGANGQPDYEAYNAAVAAFFQELPARMEGNAALVAIAGKMGATPAELLAGVDQAAVQQYWRRNDRPTQAAQRVWEETVYRPAWEAYNQAVEGGMEKGKAYERYVEGAGEVKGADLVGQIEKMYPGRWTAEELRAAVAGMTFPGVAEAATLRKPPEERALSEASSAFWDFLNEQLPPGRMGQGARENTLVKLALDAETRGTATAEQYQKALEWLEQWRAENEDPDKWLSAADWTQAREQNDAFNQAVKEQVGENVQDLLDRYYALSSGERKTFKLKHPEIGQYFDLRDEWGAARGHEVWAYFYQGKGTGGAAVATYTTGGKKARAAYVPRPRRYYKKKGKGKKKGLVPWAFERQAQWTPKVFMERVSPWGPKKEYAKPYRAQGVPWIVGKWRTKY